MLSKQKNLLIAKYNPYEFINASIIFKLFERNQIYLIGMHLMQNLFDPYKPMCKIKHESLLFYKILII